MGSIPLPALDIKTPQQPDLMSQFGNLMRLKAMQSQQQRQEELAPLQLQQAQQQVQAGQLQLQDQQRQAASQQAIMDAYANSNGDLAKAYDTAAKSGKALPGELIKLKAAQTQQKLQAFNLLKTQGEKAIQDADMFGGAVDAVHQAPPQDRPAVYQQERANLAAAGVDVSTIPAQYPGDQQFNLMRIGVQGHKNALDEAAKVATTNKDIAQTDLAKVNTKLAPQLAASRLAFQQAQLKQGAQRIGIENQNLDLRRQQSGITPNGAPSDLAQAIASGHVTPERMSYLLTRNPTLIQGVMEIDPSFDSSKAAAYPSVYKDYTNTGATKAGGAILAAGTAFQHLLELRRLNTLESRNPLSKDYAAYHNQAVTVAGELAKFYGENTDEGRKSILSTLDATFNRDKAITTQAHALGQRYDNYQNAWDNAAPSKAYQAPMPGVSKEAMEARALLDPNYKISGEASSVPMPPASGAASGSAKRVSLNAAMSLPINKGKSEADVRRDIEAHGYTVEP